MLLKIIEDLGMRFPSETAKRKRRYVKCECDCGNIIEIRKDQLGRTKSCGCARNQIRNEMPIGEKFGRLTVLEDLGIKEVNGHRERYVKVSCECNGNIYEKAWNWIRKENTQSCGCVQKERASEACREVGKISKHGMDGTKIYKIWCGMRYRCYTPTTTGYKYYGGCGIEVCKEWREDFMLFYNWAMENGYKEGLSIDRIEVDGNYEPSNCQWLTLEDNTRKMHEDRRKKAIDNG